MQLSLSVLNSSMLGFLRIPSCWKELQRLKMTRKAYRTWLKFIFKSLVMVVEKQTESNMYQKELHGSALRRRLRIPNGKWEIKLMKFRLLVSSETQEVTPTLLVELCLNVQKFISERGTACLSDLMAQTLHRNLVKCTALCSRCSWLKSRKKPLPAHKT